MKTPPPLEDVVSHWDAVADRYLELFRHELAGKPFDRQILDEFAARVGPGGRVCDAGCGPCGHVAAHLAARGLDVVGVDLSPGGGARAAGATPSPVRDHGHGGARVRRRRPRRSLIVRSRRR